MNRFWSSLAFVVLFGNSAATLWAERVALVIGNSRYVPERAADVRPNLVNPGNDAALIAETLRKAGFRVTVKTDLDKAAMEAAVRAFYSALKEGDTALFYYAGHGAQSAGVNYLVPVGVPLDMAEFEAGEKCYKAQQVLSAMEYQKTALNVVVLDCCRDNPFTRSWRSLQEEGKQGMAQMEAPQETLIAYSTAPGKVAADGRGANSPYSAALAEEMLRPGVKLEDVFKNVAARVNESTHGEQRPWTATDLLGTHYFLNGTAPQPSILDPFASVSKTTPFTNSLGMKFVPAGTPGVLFNIWETRVQDFTAFVEETKHDAISNNTFGVPAYTVEKTADGKGVEWAQKGGSWQDPHFPSKQSGEHPVVCVSYLDAEAFCAWLTQKDRASGKIPGTASYRLPTDSEWSRACGSGKYPWGESYPPGSNAGNYSGKEAMIGAYEGLSDDLVKAGRRDSAARTAAVGMFEENRFGLYDMGGNVAEWCSTWYAASLNDADVLKEIPILKDDKGGKTYRVLRGGSWYGDAEAGLRSSCRGIGGPRGRYGIYGFRVVLVVAGG